MSEAAAKLVKAIEAFRAEHGEDLGMRYVLADLSDAATRVERLVSEAAQESPGHVAAKEVGKPGNTELPKAEPKAEPKGEAAEEPSTFEAARQAAMERFKS